MLFSFTRTEITLLAAFFFFVFKQDPHRRPIGIIVLAAFHTPDKNSEKEKCQREGNGDQYDDDVHALIILRTEVATPFTASVANPTTLMLLTGISTAATSGVRWPVTAKLSATTL